MAIVQTIPIQHPSSDAEGPAQPPSRIQAIFATPFYQTAMTAMAQLDAIGPNRKKRKPKSAPPAPKPQPAAPQPKSEAEASPPSTEPKKPGLPVPSSPAIRRGEKTIYPAQRFDPKVNPENPRWAGYRPQWVVKAERVVTISPKEFRTVRALVHCMSVEQCAAFLRVPKASILMWEAGTEPIPYAAYATLQLTHELQFLPHEIKEWANWKIIAAGADVGMLINSRTGEMFSAQELNTFRFVRAEMQCLKRANARLIKKLEALQAENTRLRTLYRTDGVTKELHAMQDQLSKLLNTVNTAEVIEMPPAQLNVIRQKEASR